MTRTFRPLNKPVRFAATALCLAAGLSTYGAMAMPPVLAAATGAATAVLPAAATPPSVSSLPAVASTTVANYQAACSGTGTSTESVPICQQPLTLQPPVPPDIVLMLDDSGSMNWSVMPDYSNISDTSVAGLENSAVNGVYYNPTVTYAPPPQVDGTSYANASFGAALVNGFDTSSSPTTVDLSTYRGAYDSYNDSYLGTPVQFSIAVAKPKATTYPANASCPTGTALSGGAQPGYCYYTDNSVIPTGPFNFFATNGYFYVSRCNSVSDVYNYSTDNCTPGISFFTYVTGASGSYVRYYVAKSTGDCTAAGLSSSVCDETSTTQQNVANWYAYYHTRILMAKTGLMTAFSGLNRSYRVGFGSINGTAASWIKTNVTGTYKFSTPTKSYNYLAEVQPFGDGSSGTQKANFWSWIPQLSPANSTPLRFALDAVGQYYSGTDTSTTPSNAWDTMASDPGWSSLTPPATGSSNGTTIACRQAYTILTTDGFWNKSFNPSNYTGGTTGPSDTTGTTVTGPNTATYTYTPAAPYSGGETDDGSPSLADVAMYYWKNDLQPAIDNEVPTNKEDPAFWQHMVTFTMGLGFTPTGIQPAGTTIDQILAWANGGAAITGFSWPTPSSNSINNIADLAHAGVNGHGGFFSATNPQTFISGLQSALQRAAERTGSGASLAANSTQLKTGTVAYQATYHTAVWTGDLAAFGINQTTGAVATTPTWSASTQLVAGATKDATTGVLTYPSRNIMTYNPTAKTFVAFQNTSTGAPPALSGAELTALGGSASVQAAVVNYLRGDATYEQGNGGNFRTRATPLGDVIDSQPVYEGAPDPNEFSGQTFYGTAAVTVGSGASATMDVPFYDWAVGTTDATSGVFTASAASQRKTVVFVSSNDGMLHEFDSSTGDELFAYLPAAVITAGVANLANPAYGTDADPHQDYNDGQLTVADAYVQIGTDTSPQWHTILVGTTGRGSAKAVYALDVTDPTNIKFLWERSAGDGKANSKYIGQMIGKPVIAQTNYQPAGGKFKTASSNWSVLIGNGYNSASGTAALLQFDLVTGDLGESSIGGVHATDTTTSNGLTAPLVWLDNPADGVSTVAYAGDLKGRVWSFALNDSTGSNASPTSTGTLLFTAKDPSGTAEPITAGMLGGKDPVASNLWVFFGTGKYLQYSDLHNTQVQRWYGIIVQPVSSGTPALPSNFTPSSVDSSSKNYLVQRYITAQQAASGTTLAARTVTPMPATSDMTGKLGWFMNLQTPSTTTPTTYTSQGEMMVDPNQFQGNVLLGTTRIPVVTDLCDPSGSGWVMALDPFTGTAPSNDFFDLNGDGKINSSDRVGGNIAAGVGFSSMPNAPIFVGGDMLTGLQNAHISNVNTSGATGQFARVSWREVVNP